MDDSPVQTARHARPLKKAQSFIHFGIIVEDLASVYNTLREGGFEFADGQCEKKADEISADKTARTLFQGIGSRTANVV